MLYIKSVPNLIAFDLVGVQPMDNKSGMINYFNYNYSNTKGKVKAGDTFNSSLNMGPSNPDYTSDIVRDHVVTFDGKNAVLDWAPVVVDTFMVKITKADGSVKKGMCQPGSFGNITDIAGAAMGNVTPAGTLELATAPEATDVVTVTYKYMNNVVKANGYEEAGFTDAPAAELQIKSVPVNAVTRTMRAYNTQCAA